MAFVQRQLRLTFSGARTGTIQVAGLRTRANIEAYQGRSGVMAQVRVWGLTLEQMNAYSSRIAQGVGIDKFNLAIEAGDIGGPLKKIVSGAIWRSYIDLHSAPESSFVVDVAGVILLATKTIGSQSHPGPQPAETLIQSVCAAAGLTLHNNGAHAVVRNHATYGSAIDQISDIARAAKFSLYIDGNDVWIWPYGKARDAVVIDSAIDERVSYPLWWDAGIVVVTEFNRDIQVGRQMRVTSTISKANGIWQIIKAQHDLATMEDGGPWFSIATLAPVGSV